MMHYYIEALYHCGLKEEAMALNKDFWGQIDYKNSGIGSASCGTQLMEKYRLAEKEIHLKLYIR